MAESNADIRASFLKSRFGKMLREYCAVRREYLLAQTPDTERVSAMRDGAMFELTRLYRNPELVANVAHMEQRKKARLDTEPDGLDADPVLPSDRLFQPTMES